MTKPRSRRFSRGSSLLAALPILLLLDPSSERSTAREAGRRPTKRKIRQSGVRATWPARGARNQIFRLAQVLLQDARNKQVCRTSIAGTFETGQSAVRIDLIEREGDKMRAVAAVPSRRPLPAGRR